MSKPREPVKQPQAEGIIVGGTVRGKEMEKSKLSRLKCHLCKREKEHESGILVMQPSVMKQIP